MILNDFSVRLHITKCKKVKGSEYFLTVGYCIVMEWATYKTKHQMPHSFFSCSDNYLPLIL